MTEEEFTTPLSIAAGITDQMRLLVIEMFARGYTVRAIRRRIMREAHYEPSETELLRMSMEYAEDIDTAREEIREMVLSQGLINKHERILRLTQVAEALEPDATGQGDKPVSLKATTTYLRTLKQIQEEVEPLNIQVRLPEGDTWGQLLSGLHDLASKRRILLQQEREPDDAPKRDRM